MITRSPHSLFKKGSIAMKSTAEAIKDLREKYNLTQQELGEMAGVSNKAVWSWENGLTEPRMGAIERISMRLGIKKSEVLGWEHPDPPARNLILPNAKTVPILGRISCGNGNFLNDDSEGTFTLDYSIKADYCLIASGDSMIDAGIENGDKVFLSQNYEFTDGKVYGVVLKGEDIAVLKMVNKIDDKFLLQSCNSSGQYKPIIVDQSEICIVGECVGIYKSL